MEVDGNEKVPCTVCEAHGTVAQFHALQEFPYDPCELCGTIILFCAPWPDMKAQPQWWERCTGENCGQRCKGLPGRIGGHVRCVHDRMRCRMARLGTRMTQPPVVEAPGEPYDAVEIAFDGEWRQIGTITAGMIRAESIYGQAQIIDEWSE